MGDKLSVVLEIVDLSLKQTQVAFQAREFSSFHGRERVEAVQPPFWPAQKAVVLCVSWWDCWYTLEMKESSEESGQADVSLRNNTGRDWPQLQQWTEFASAQSPGSGLFLAKYPKFFKRMSPWISQTSVLNKKSAATSAILK